MAGGWWSPCSYLAIAVSGSISSSYLRRGKGGPAEVRVEGGEVKGHRAVEVIFFIPLRWARVEQPTGSRTGGTFLLRAE